MKAKYRLDIDAEGLLITVGQSLERSHPMYLIFIQHLLSSPNQPFKLSTVLSQLINQRLKQEGVAVILGYLLLLMNDPILNNSIFAILQQRMATESNNTAITQAWITVTIMLNQPQRLEAIFAALAQESPQRDFYINCLYDLGAMPNKEAECWRITFLGFVAKHQDANEVKIPMLRKLMEIMGCDNDANIDLILCCLLRNDLTMQAIGIDNLKNLARQRENVIQHCCVLHILHVTLANISLNSSGYNTAIDTLCLLRLSVAPTAAQLQMRLLLKIFAGATINIKMTIIESLGNIPPLLQHPALEAECIHVLIQQLSLENNDRYLCQAAITALKTVPRTRDESLEKSRIDALSAVAKDYWSFSARKMAIEALQQYQTNKPATLSRQKCVWDSPSSPAMFVSSRKRPLLGKEDGSPVNLLQRHL